MVDGIELDKMLDLKKLKAYYSKTYKIKEQNIHIKCKAGQDEFNMPGIYKNNNIAHIVFNYNGNFTFRTTCNLYANNKFDASGIYLIVGKERIKFGIEF